MRSRLAGVAAESTACSYVHQGGVSVQEGLAQFVWRAFDMKGGSTRFVAEATAGWSAHGRHEGQAIRLDNLS